MLSEGKAHLSRRAKLDTACCRGASQLNCSARGPPVLDVRRLALVGDLVADELAHVLDHLQRIRLPVCGGGVEGRRGRDSEMESCASRTRTL